MGAVASPYKLRLEMNRPLQGDPMAREARLSQKTLDAFYREIGLLVFWFAASENTMYLIAQQLLGGRKLAGPVLSNLHLERTIELVRALARELYSGSVHHSEFDSALLDFKQCAQKRNRLLHSLS